MPETLTRLLSQIKEISGRLTGRQKTTILVAVVVAVAGLIALLTWVGRTEYAVLFSNLDPKDANVIVDKLKATKTPYELKSDGTTILVPKDQLYELRLEMAGQGLPQLGSVGYEIFDKNNIGLTDFVQKLNYRRALEGELARTIRGLSEIASARVHIVIPEPSLFTEQQKETTASVALKLQPGARLAQNQIQGIAYLVASSVEGLKSENITIIDSFGNVLSDLLEKDSLVALSATQLDLQKKVESYLTDKATSLLEGVIGKNNAIIRVTAELDFDRVERNIEKYDPESATVRSEQTNTDVTTTNSDKPSRRETTVTNYEINKTLEHVVETVGNIKRLSVAVLVNGTTQSIARPKGKPEKHYVPRSPEEMTKLTNLVKNAVGFDVSRNDQVEVTNIAFDNSALEQQAEVLDKAEKVEFRKSLLQKAVVLVAIILLALLLRSGMKSFKTSVLQTKSGSAPGLPSASMIPEEVRQRIDKQKQMMLLSRERPEEVARLLKSWIVEK